MVRVLDVIGAWIARVFGPVKMQVRVGVACVLGSIPLAVYGPWSGEQFLIYEMSAAALTITGVGIIIAALPSDPNDRIT